MGVSVIAKNSVFMEMLFPEDFVFEGVEKVCNNKNCKKFKKTINGNFCSECGSQVEKEKIEARDFERVVREFGNGNISLSSINSVKADFIEFAGASPVNPECLLFECYSNNHHNVMEEGFAVLYKSPVEQERMIEKADESFSELVLELESQGVKVGFQCLPYVSTSV